MNVTPHSYDQHKVHIFQNKKATYQFPHSV